MRKKISRISPKPASRSKWSIGANIGSAWRPPSLNELYSDGVHHGTAQFEIGDLNLQSERSFNLDVTLRHLSASARAEISGYNNRMPDFIMRIMPIRRPAIRCLILISARSLNSAANRCASTSARKISRTKRIATI